MQIFENDFIKSNWKKIKFSIFWTFTYLQYIKYIPYNPTCNFKRL
jgi:hypothetical protein